ncbi:MAG: T9SS type A sorting domain-containing protein [Chitinophagales bacterium]
MSKEFKLTIPDPCHENWDHMTQTEKGRFCASCQKHVIDFRNMSDSQLAVFFKKHSESSLCGRLFHDQLDRNIGMPKKQISWIKYFFQFTLPAFLISMKAAAQGNVKFIQPDTIVKPRTVFIPARNCFSNESPVNSMSNNRATQPVIAVNMPEFAFLTKANPQLPVNQVLAGRAGGIIIIEPPEKNKIPKQISLLTQKLMDSAFKFFKVFPNPASQGTSLHIEWKQTEEGYFTFELIDVSGKKVYSKEIWIDEEARLLNLEVPSVRPGNYFLRAANKRSGKTFTERISIQ